MILLRFTIPDSDSGVSYVDPNRIEVIEPTTVGCRLGMRSGEDFYLPGIDADEVARILSTVVRVLILDADAGPTPAPELPPPSGRRIRRLEVRPILRVSDREDEDSMNGALTAQDAALRARRGAAHHAGLDEAADPPHTYDDGGGAFVR